MKKIRYVRYDNGRRRSLSLSARYRQSINSQISWEQLLTHFRCNTTHTRHGTIRLLCPFHNDRDPSMKINLPRRLGAFQCYACGESGDKVDFILAMLGFRSARVQVKKACIASVLSAISRGSP
jgi:hypothetical protein